jgi:hypothetical protein
MSSTSERTVAMSWSTASAPGRNMAPISTPVAATITTISTSRATIAPRRPAMRSPSGAVRGWFTLDLGRSRRHAQRAV